MGAAVVEKPGTYGPSATITLQGSKARKWSLRPQVSLGFRQTGLRAADCRPGDPAHRDLRRRASLPRSARDATASPTTPTNVPPCGTRVTWCGRSATMICSASNLVSRSSPPGSTRRPPASSLVSSTFSPAWFACRPKIRCRNCWSSWSIRISTRGEHFSTWMPYLFVRSDNRVKSDSDEVAAAALATLDGSTPFAAAGSDMCWTYADWRRDRHRRRARPSRSATGRARRRRSRRPVWKVWTVRRGRSGCGCRTGWASATPAASPPVPCSTSAPVSGPAETDETGCPGAEWQAVSTRRCRMPNAISSGPSLTAGVAVPELGYETDGRRGDRHGLGRCVGSAWCSTTGEAAATGGRCARRMSTQIVEAVEIEWSDVGGEPGYRVEQQGDVQAGRLGQEQGVRLLREAQRRRHPTRRCTSSR